jgi:hypothetical protein
LVSVVVVPEPALLKTVCPFWIEYVTIESIVSELAVKSRTFSLVYDFASGSQIVIDFTPLNVRFHAVISEHFITQGITEAVKSSDGLAEASAASFAASFAETQCADAASRAPRASAASTARAGASGATASWTAEPSEEVGLSVKIQVHTPLSQPQKPLPSVLEDVLVDGLAVGAPVVTGALGADEADEVGEAEGFELAEEPEVGLPAEAVGVAVGLLPAAALDVVVLGFDALCPVGQTLGNGRLGLDEAASAGAAA